MRYIEQILQPGEKLLYSGTIHWVIYGPAIIFSVIALALLNALAFRRRWRLVGDVSLPRARLMAALSIVFWLSVVILGRLIAYF